MTLEETLRLRLNDSRAMHAVLNINADRVFIDFGQVNDLGPVRLRVRGDEVAVVYPTNDDPDPDGLLSSAPAGQDGQGGPVGGVGSGEGASPASGPENAPETVSPDGYTRDDLIALAAAEGVTHAANATKAQIADAINAARAQQAGQGG